MKKYFTLLLAVLFISLTVSAQRYTLDSFDIRTGLGPSDPSMFMPYKNKLYFFATDIVNFNTMFETDGISDPKLVGSPSTTPRSGNYNPGNAAVEVDGILYYSATLSSTGRELYMYDGITAPSIVKDIVPGAAGSNPHNLSIYNSKIYFSTMVGGIADIMEYDTYTKGMRSLSGKYVDTFRDELYHGVLGFFQVNNKLCFAAKTNNTGLELFEYDLVNDTITLVADILPGADGSKPHALHVYNNKLYFAAIDSTHGCELWMYDGVNSPTRLTDIQPGKHWGLPYGATSARVQIIGYNSNVYFSALSDTLVNSKPVLYKYDLGAGNASLVYDNKNANGYLGPASNFIIYGNDLFYQDKYTYYNTIWTYDGTDSPRVITFDGGVYTRNFLQPTIFNKAVYFQSESTDKGKELYRLYDSAVSVKDVSAHEQLSVVAYPNPATEDVQLSFSLKQSMSLSVGVTTINGEVVYSKQLQRYSDGTTTITVPVQQLPTGTYIYSIMNKDGALLNSGKLMKQ